MVGNRKLSVLIECRLWAQELEGLNNAEEAYTGFMVASGGVLSEG